MRRNIFQEVRRVSSHGLETDASLSSEPSFSSHTRGSVLQAPRFAEGTFGPHAVLPAPRRCRWAEPQVPGPVFASHWAKSTRGGGRDRAGVQSSPLLAPVHAARLLGSCPLPTGPHWPLNHDCEWQLGDCHLSPSRALCPPARLSSAGAGPGAPVCPRVTFGRERRVSTGVVPVSRYNRAQTGLRIGSTRARVAFPAAWGLCRF